MSDDAPTPGPDEPGEAGRASRRRSTSGDSGGLLPDPETTARYLQWGVLAALLLLGVIAAVGLYTSAGRVIDVWVTARYQPVVRTVFNAALLLVAGAGVSAVLRRLDAG